MVLFERLSFLFFPLFTVYYIAIMHDTYTYESVRIIMSQHFSDHNNGT